MSLVDALSLSLSFSSRSLLGICAFPPVRLLEYFGEFFPSSECKRMKRTVCDNCRQVLKTTTIDCTQMSIDIIQMASEFTHKNITIPTALDVLRGANTKGIRDAGHNNLAAYNSCSQLTRNGT